MVHGHGSNVEIRKNNASPGQRRSSVDGDKSKALVSGAGTVRLNGTYVKDPGAKQRHGCSRPYRQVAGDGTVEYNELAGTIEFNEKFGEWWITERYAGQKFYICVCCSEETRQPPSTPPNTGWDVISGAPA